MPKYCLLVVVRIQHLNVQVQKGHHASMLVTSSGRDPILECFSAERSPYLNIVCKW